MPPIMTLTTDFGYSDGYVAAMKGRILTILPQCRLVDITHGVAPGNIMKGALVVRDVAPYFPPGTVHVVVVDPGVGTSRQPLIARTPFLTAVGPDNGVLSLLWEDIPEARFFRIDVDAVAAGPVSSTFHGRDIFAPAAAMLASGVAPERLGTPVSEPIELELPKPVQQPGLVQGEILYGDSFGNLVTNIRQDQLPGDADQLIVEVAGQRIHGMVRTYGLGQDDLIALLGSTGLLEIAVPDGSAYAELGVDFGTPVVVMAGGTDPDPGADTDRLVSAGDDEDEGGSSS